MSRSRLPVPPAAALKTSYDQTKSIRLSAIQFNVSHQTLNMWLREYGIQIKPQGAHDGNRWRYKNLLKKGNAR